MKKHFLLGFLSTIILACASDTKSKKELVSDATVVEEQPVINNHPVTFIVSNTMKKEYVSIYRNLSFNSFMKEKHLYTDKMHDTISFNIKNAETVYVSSKYTTKDTLLVKNGDTIYVDLDNKKLETTHKNTEKLHVFNLKNNLTDSLTKPFYFIDYNAPLALKSNKYQKLNPIYPLRIQYETFKTKTTALLNLANVLVKRHDEIVKKYNVATKNFPKDTPYYEELKNELNYSLFAELCKLYQYSKNEDLKTIITSTRFFNDDTIEEHNLYKKLSVFIQQIILDGKRVREKFKLKVDYKTAFSAIPKYFQDKKLIAAAKFVAINGDAMQGTSKESLSNMIEKFNNEFTDKAYAAYFKKMEEDYGLSKRITSQDAKNVYITDLNGTSTQLDSFINKNKGNVIYVDFWASWCAPCRAVMPDSKKLASMYKDQKVVFAYVSIDSNKSQWKKAIVAENLETTKANFLATNYPKAVFYKDLHINTIPRYLLFDKQGSLVHENAPGPDSDEIKSLLNHLLTK